MEDSSAEAGATRSRRGITGYFKLKGILPDKVGVLET
jgi:hypothetical protein